MLSRIGPAAQRRIDQLLAAAREARREPFAPLAIYLTPGHPDGDILFAYWENQLDTAGQEAVEKHARGCPHCLAALIEVGRLFTK
jgi:hypothetical protein